MAGTSKLLQLRHGPAGYVGTFVGADRELIVDDTNHRVLLQDAATPGGHPMARLDEVLSVGRTVMPDGNYQALTTDLGIALVIITASRVLTLPPAASYRPMLPWLSSTSGSLAPAVTLTIAAAGSDTIANQPSIIMQAAYQSLIFRCNGANLWTFR